MLFRRRRAYPVSKHLCDYCHPQSERVDKSAEQALSALSSLLQSPARCCQSVSRDGSSARSQNATILASASAGSCAPSSHALRVLSAPSASTHIHATSHVEVAAPRLPKFCIYAVPGRQTAPCRDHPIEEEWKERSLVCGRARVRSLRADARCSADIVRGFAQVRTAASIPYDEAPACWAAAIAPTTIRVSRPRRKPPRGPQ